MLEEMLGPARTSRPLGAVAERARAADPEARYRNGQEMLEAIEAAGGALPRRSRWGVAGIALAVVVALGAGAWLLQRGADGTGRVGVAVADFENDTGDPELDDLAGLLATSLAQSPHLSVVPRTRMLDGMGLALDGGNGPDRIDVGGGA